MTDERGFTLIEVAVASLITTIGLVFLATLFTLAISQNRLVSHYTSTTMLAQQKLEELEAIERTDARLTIGGGLDEASKQPGFFDRVYVADSGMVTTVAPAAPTPSFLRYWSIEPDPLLSQALIMSVRVVSDQPARGRAAEETTLTTSRSW
ncbi:MAG TPA: prepilin-type N-terminal cleavage/methylation domain-containing protein [Blastocatellia bacterium]|nr:prepilin-type N-terminal cleavage/methylation domain-containing protein [Blastocatellia bacterium]